MKYILEARKPDPNLIQQLNFILRDIETRLNEIEFTLALPLKKPDLSLAKKMILMHHLGIISHLREMGLSNVKMSAILSPLINKSEPNIRADLSDMTNPKSMLLTKDNYTFLAEITRQAGLDEIHWEILQALNGME